MDLYLFSDINNGLFNEIRGKLENLTENEEIILHVNSYGGDVAAGWAIYDALRQAEGHTIKAIVEGVCASMASVIILAATKENRKATPDAQFLIHTPATDWLSGDMYERLTAENVEKIGEYIESQRTQLKAEEDKILAVMAERTGATAETLLAQMKTEQWFGNDRAFELGLIGSIEGHKTATAPQNRVTNMKKIKAKKNVNDNVFRRLFLDFVRKSADGVDIEIDNEDGTPEVGVTARPDGTFVLDDGTTITIEDGRITAVEKANTEDEEPTDVEERLTALRADVDALTARVEALERAAEGDGNNGPDTNEDGELLDFVRENRETITALMRNPAFKSFQTQKSVGKGNKAGQQTTDKSEVAAAYISKAEAIREKMGRK